MKQNAKQTRDAARIAAEDKILETANSKPEMVSATLISNPGLFRELGDDMAKTIVLALLGRGQQENLQRLLGQKSIGRRKSVLLANLLLLDAFGE